MDQSAYTKYQNGKSSDVEDKPDTASIWVHGEEFWPLSGKPYFHVSLKKTHLSPHYQMVLPKKISDLLPSTILPVIIDCRGHYWMAKYNGLTPLKRLYDGWKNIVDMLKLKIGDVCVMELTQNSATTLKFRLQILKTEIPPELLNREAKEGQSPEVPLVID